MNFQDLRDRDSELVQAAFERRCPVCKAKPGQECQALTGGPLTAVCGHYSHILRADGMPYSTPKKAS